MQRSQEGQQPRFTVIHHGVRKTLGLTLSEYVLLDTVYHLSAKYGHCYASTSSLADILGQSFNGTKYVIERMIERELLIRNGTSLLCTQAYIEVAYLEKSVETIEIAKSAKIAKSAINRGGRLRKLQSIAKSSDNNNNNNKLLRTKDIQTTFDKLKETLQTKARYSDSYSKLVRKALTTLTQDELVQAAEHFKWKFKGGSTWHTSSPKFYTLVQFLSSNREGIPRFETCYEESQDRQVVPTNTPNLNQNPNLDKYFPS